MRTRSTIFFLLISVSLCAQHAVRGRVVEKANPVEFVNVYITHLPDTAKIIVASVTDSLGRFELQNITTGQYQLTAQIVGYRPTRQSISVTSSIDVGDIEIAPSMQMLNAVEINAMKSAIQKTDEGFVVSASANITQIGGTAADLLKNIPGVLVDGDGGITLRGKTPLTLINGRVSGITGVDRSAQLERIPASSIEKIEIINNPSAKYDADAEGGVINIILKKNEDNGTNGAFALGAGVGSRYRLNASLLVNHKKDKWNFGFEYDNWYTTRTRRIKADRINYDIPDEYFLRQRRFDERLIFYQNAKATIDFVPTKRDAINFELLWAFPGEDNRETLRNTFETSDETFMGSRKRFSNEIRRSHELEGALKYNRSFPNSEKHLSALFSNAFGNERENTGITNQSLSSDNVEISDVFLQRTHTYQNTNLTNIALDYVHPMFNSANLETGYKTILRYLNSDFQRANQQGADFVIDPLNTNVFTFNEQIHAVYSQINGWKGSKDSPRWKYTGGLRAEQVLNNGKTLDETTAFNNSYFKVYPSASLAYYSRKESSVRFSYSRRINRPGLGQLNPFIDITDSLNQHGGNPRLKPEFIHSMELGYSQSWEKASLTITGFYRQRNNAIFQYTTLDANGVAFARPLNFGRASVDGAELLASANPSSSWSVNFSFSVFETHINDKGAITGLSNDQLSWYTKLINNINLFRDTKVQVIGSYTAPTPTPQGKSMAVYYVDLGLQQKIAKGKGRLGLTVTDIFNTQKYGATTSDSNFFYHRVGKLDARAVMLTFGYSFGTSFKEKMMENRFKNE